MKFNMGCGHNRLDGWVNVDAAEACNPDQVWDLETTPWPWPDNCAGEVLFNHSLEHMGADPKVFLAMVAELYRIMRPGGSVEIRVPHPRHDDFINDPTHVRAITPNVLSLFDRELNDAWKVSGASNTPLAHYLGVDFKICEVRTILSEPYAAALRDGRMAEAAVKSAIAERNNVVREFHIRLVARKSVEAIPVDQQAAIRAGA